MNSTILDEVNKLSLNGLKDILKDLELYKYLKKDLGKRGIRKYNKIKTGKLDLSVEYFPVLSKDYVIEESIKIFENIFNLKDIKKDSIRLVENEEINGGLRIFVEDKVLDLTYSKIEKQFS